MTETIGLVVEGHGEERSAAGLVRRIASEVYDRWDLTVARPFRLPRGRMTSDHLHRAVSVVVANTGGSSVLVILDADDDCALELAEQVRTAAGRPVEVAVAVREYEAWFLYALPSLSGHPAIGERGVFAEDLEGLANPKDRLEACMNEKYRETLHQPAFTALMDLGQARRSKSFEHLVRCVGRLV